VKTLGVAVIGLGVGKQHALAYLRSGKCKVRWLYDLDTKVVDRLLEELGEGARADSLDDIFTDKSVDVVSIASYDDAHFEQVVSALHAKKHVFVEKPMCRSLRELEVIKEIWESVKNCRLVSNLVLRAAPVYQWLKRTIDVGQLGDLYAFDGDYLYGRIHKITEGWRNTVDNYSVMQGGGVHLVDLMLWLTGQKPTSVNAVGNRICTAGTEFRYKDYVSATFQFDSGLVGRVTANFGCVHQHQHVVRIFGTRATFIYDDEGARLHTTRDPAASAESLHLPALPATKGDLIPDFVQAILEPHSNTQTQHDFDVIAICLAADQAVAVGKAIKIKYL